MQYYISTLLLVVALTALAGCGQTGPLYMPPETTPVPPAMAEPNATPVTPPSATQSAEQPHTAAP